MIRAFLVLSLLAVPVLADGFHSPLLRERDPRKWATTLRENLGLDRSDSAEGDPPVSPTERRAAAGNLIDVLRYLNRRNVLLREFPDFDYDAIPGFKSETEALLVALGKDAVPLLVETLATDLRSGESARGMVRSADFEERLVRILVAIGEDSLPEVLAHAGDDDPRVRRTMLRILREIVGEPDFGDDLDLWRRWFAIRRAGRDRDAKQVGELVARFADDDRRLRLAAARALGEIGDRRAVPALTRLLAGGGDGTLVRAALRALAKIGDDAAAPEMVERLEDADEEIRAEAATALRFLSHRSFGFDPGAPAADRKAAVERWREWAKRR